MLDNMKVLLLSCFNGVQKYNSEKVKGYSASYGPSVIVPLDDFHNENVLHKEKPIVERQPEQEKDGDGKVVQIGLCEGDGSFVNRLVGRNEEIRYSSRDYYRTGSELGVPFAWEAGPGKPKKELVDYHEDELIPPLTPPPLFHSTSFPKRNES